jgi:hypothetical protein
VGLHGRNDRNCNAGGNQAAFDGSRARLIANELLDYRLHWATPLSGFPNSLTIAQYPLQAQSIMKLTTQAARKQCYER